jgi:hypothetical protein
MRRPRPSMGKPIADSRWLFTLHPGRVLSSSSSHLTPVR